MEGSLREHFKNREITTLVENRTIYQSDYSEMNIFETQKKAEKISLTFSFPIIASMLQGKKIMHLEDKPSFHFLPGESLVLPSNKEMVIDFPEASLKTPTQCLALGIDEKKVEEVVERFNVKVQMEGEGTAWNLTSKPSYLLNNIQVNALINRLIQTYTTNCESREVLLDIMLQELIVRLLQTQAKSALLYDPENILSDTRMGYVLQYIKQNFKDHTITVETLAEKACMSVSHFHKKFKNTLGISPIDYINEEKIKFAKRLIKERKNLPISEVALMSGFNSVSYFNRQFKKMEMMTPMKFKQII